MAVSEPPPVHFTIHPPLHRADLPGLCLRLQATAGIRRGTPVCLDLHELPADAVALDALARLTLIARRAGWALTLAGASAELRDLLEFTGLDEVLGV